MPPKKGKNVLLSVITSHENIPGISYRRIVDLNRLCKKGLTSDNMTAKLRGIVHITTALSRDAGDAEGDTDATGEDADIMGAIDLWRQMLLDFLRHLKFRVSNGDTSITILVTDEYDSGIPYDVFGRVYKHGRYDCSIEKHTSFFLDALKTWMDNAAFCAPCIGFEGKRLAATVDFVYTW
jgi:hypothetical protein